MPSPEVFEVSSVEETLEVAERLAGELLAGSVVHLAGALGAGKTQFAKGLGRGLGLDPDAIGSPTFTFIHVHEGRGGRPGLIHVDLYRLRDPEELTELGLSELPGPTNLAAVEWPERLGASAASGAVRVELLDRGGSRRRIVIRRPAAGESSPGRIA